MALAVYAAAGLAKANIWTAGWEAMKTGAAGFIVPFMFVYYPGLLLIGPWQQVAIDITLAVIAIAALAASLNGYLFARLAMWQRVLLFAGAASMIKPGVYTDFIGLGVVLLVALLQLFSRRPEPDPVAAGPVRGETTP